jgi:predicted TIM-barrel enzyme
MFEKLRAYAVKLGMDPEVAETANIAVITTFIVSAIFMSIGVVVLYNVETATPAIANSSAWYTTQTNLATTTQSGYGLLAISLIVLAAAGILGGLFMFVRGRAE